MLFLRPSEIANVSISPYELRIDSELIITRTVVSRNRTTFSNLIVIRAYLIAISLWLGELVTLRIKSDVLEVGVLNSLDTIYIELWLEYDATEL